MPGRCSRWQGRAKLLAGLEMRCGAADGRPTSRSGEWALGVTVLVSAGYTNRPAGACWAGRVKLDWPPNAVKQTLQYQRPLDSGEVDSQSKLARLTGTPRATISALPATSSPEWCVA